MADGNELGTVHKPSIDTSVLIEDDLPATGAKDINPALDGLALLQEGCNPYNSNKVPDILPKFDNIVEQKTEQKHPGEALFSAEKISKIVKVSVTKEGIKTLEEIKPKDGEFLSKGDYKIFWKVGKDPKSGESIERAALLHTPEGKDLGLLVLVPGVSNKDQLSENYLMETHLHELADEGEEKYAVLTLLTEKREIGPESKAKGIKSSAWVVDGCFLHKDVVDQLRQENKERTGIAYDDRDYVAGVLNTCSRLAPVDNNQRNWGFVGGSQGGAFITRLCGDERFHDIANVYIVGSSAEASGEELQLPGDKHNVAPYRINDGNAQHVLIFQHRNDTLALPHPDKLSLVKATASTGLLHRQAVNLGLGAFDNLHQNPLKLESIYLRSIDKTISRQLGDSGQYIMKGYIPANAAEKLKIRPSFGQELKTNTELTEARLDGKDLLYSYYLKRQNGEAVSVDVYDLPANHVIAGRAEGSTSIYKKYDGVDEPGIIDKDMENLIKQRKASKK